MGRSQRHLRQEAGLDSNENDYWPATGTDAHKGRMASSPVVEGVIVAGATTADDITLTLYGGTGSAGSVLSVEIWAPWQNIVGTASHTATAAQTLDSMATALAAAIDALTGVSAAAVGAVITITPGTTAVAKNFKYA